MEEESEPLGSDRSLNSDEPAELDELLIFGGVATRRKFLKQIAGTGAALTFGPGLLRFGAPHAAAITVTDASAGGGSTPAELASVNLKINGESVTLHLDPRTTLL